MDVGVALEYLDVLRLPLNVGKGEAVAAAVRAAPDAEIYLLVDQYGVEEFQIVDDIFNLHKPRLKMIFAGLEQRYGVGKLHFIFPNGLRGDILTEDVVKTLKRGGTYALSLAVETVTPRLQTLIEKDLDIPKTKRFIDLCYQEGILARGFFMLGFPTETKKELLSTIWFALRSHLRSASRVCRSSALSTRGSL